jgi:hypothetical protein
VTMSRTLARGPGSTQEGYQQYKTYLNRLCIVIHCRVSQNVAWPVEFVVQGAITDYRWP